jgi:hypothetical protein
VSLHPSQRDRDGGANGIRWDFGREPKSSTPGGCGRHASILPARRGRHASVGNVRIIDGAGSCAPLSSSPLTGRSLALRMIVWSRMGWGRTSLAAVDGVRRGAARDCEDVECRPNISLSRTRRVSRSPEQCAELLSAPDALAAASELHASSPSSNKTSSSNFLVEGRRRGKQSPEKHA